MTSIDGTMRASLHTQKLNEKMALKLKTLDRRRIFQHDIDPNPTAKLRTKYKTKLKL